MSDTSTRSGMLWEVERILTESKEKPQILLMENVPQVHGEGNSQDFNKWQLKLEELGYKNYWQDLIATDYGIPQTRNRCFMVSILGDYSYSFPPKQPLKLRLKDMLEDEVDEKYFLSNKMLDYCLGINQKESKFPRGQRFLQSLQMTNEKGIATTINTSAGNRPVDNFILKSQVIGGIGEKKSNSGTQWYQQDRIYDDNVSISITTSFNPYYAVNENVIIGSTQKHASKKNDGICTTLTSAMGSGGGHVPMHNYTEDLRIRKLTPKECFRLMGVKDEDYEKIAKNQSNASLYHLAGDSIVVDVIKAILKEML